MSRSTPSVIDVRRLRLHLESLSAALPRPLLQSEIDLCLLYYDLVCKWNPLLHLTTLLSPEDFAVRHLGESFLAESRLLPDIKELWDIGSGAGIPGLPIAIRRPDLSVKLIESNRRKAVFLNEAAFALGLGRVRVLAERFDSLPLPTTDTCLTARAVERMEMVVREIISRSRASSQLLIFGNKELAALIESELPPDWQLVPVLLPGSAGRYIFDLKCFTWNTGENAEHTE